MPNSCVIIITWSGNTDSGIFLYLNTIRNKSTGVSIAIIVQRELRFVTDNTVHVPRLIISLIFDYIKLNILFLGIVTQISVYIIPEFLGQHALNRAAARYRLRRIKIV